MDNKSTLVKAKERYVALRGAKTHDQRTARRTAARIIEQEERKIGVGR